MNKLTKQQFAKMDAWVKLNARPFDRAKWDLLFCGGSRDAVLAEMLKYQNADGGFGNAFESDILLPDSSAIASTEAVFQSYKYGLDISGKWFSRLLLWFERNVKDITRFWEDVPPAVIDYPRAPWWGYSVSENFSPNPCAAISSALILYGTPSQRELGERVARRCLKFLQSEDFCGDHDTYNLMMLVEKLLEVKSPLVTDEVMSAIKRRITSNVCYDTSRYMKYVPQPLDFADSPSSPWYDIVKDGIDANLRYLVDTISPEGVWQPNFSWGEDSEVSRQATQNWKGYIAVKRAEILREYEWME
ncbi:MAG: hypothetical protein AB9835_00980 [Eubacteriales bacterium]